MGLEFLARVQRASWVAGLLIVLGIVATGIPGRALGFGAGLAWSSMNLALLTFIVTGIVRTPQTPGNPLARLALGFAGTLVMLALGGWLLLELPPLALAAGFTLPFAVMVLKAASRMLLASRYWARLTRSAWTGVVILALAIGLVWGGATWLRPAQASTAAPHAAAQHEKSASGLHPMTETREVRDIKESVHGESADKGPAMFPNAIGLIVAANHAQPWAKTLHHFEFVVFAMLVALVIALVTIAATRNFQMIPGPMQNLVESGVEAAYDFFVGILGPRSTARASCRSWARCSSTSWA